MATVELFGAKALVAIVLVGFVVLYIYSQIRQHRDIKKLGGYAPKVSTKIPFGKSHIILWLPRRAYASGLDVVYGLFRAGRLMNEIDIWHWLFSYAPYNKTVEFKIGTQRMVFTADPDNIRALLATQFGDYGKGEHFHRGMNE